MDKIIGKIAVILKRILPKEAYVKVRKAYRDSRRFLLFFICYPAIYSIHARRPVCKGRVLFVEPEYSAISNNYRLIWERLERGYDFDLKLFLLRKNQGGRAEYHKRCKQLMKELADAQYVFFDDALAVPGHVHFRKETKICNVWHACGAFKKFGFGTADLIFGENRKNQEKYPTYIYMDEFYVSAPEVVDKYAYSTGLPEEKVIPLGVSRTDVFFDEGFKKAARKKLELFFPASAGKRVILYAPTFRGRVARAAAPTVFSVPMFYEALKDEYVLIMNHHPFIKKRPAIPEKYREFAVDFTGVMTIDELICVADICISDYSSLVFEYSLMERPMIFFAFDIAEYNDWRGFYYSYEEMTPGPIFTRNKEMIEYIKHIDECFDRQEVIAFRDKFMSSCDGHVTERLFERVFGNELESHRKIALSEDKCMTGFAAEADSPGITGLSDPGKLSETGRGDGKPEAESVAADPARVKEIRERIEYAYPQIGGKKLIAYCILNKAVKSYPVVRPYADWVQLYEDLPADYSVICCETEGRAFKPPFSSDTIFKIPQTVSKEELLMAADVIVTNFDKDAIRLGNGKPLYFMVPDYRWRCRDISQYTRSVEKLRENGIFCETVCQLADVLEVPYPDISQRTLLKWTEELIESNYSAQEFFVQRT